MDDADIDWAPLVRLQEQHRAAKDPRTRDALENAMTRMVEALHRGQPRTGTIETARSNHRRRERRRTELESLMAPLLTVANDPWPELDRLLARDHALRDVKPATRVLLDLLAAGYTYGEIGERAGKPVGTVKSQVSRAKAAVAA